MTSPSLLVLLAAPGAAPPRVAAPAPAAAPVRAAALTQPSNPFCCRPHKQWAVRRNILALNGGGPRTSSQAAQVKAGSKQVVDVAHIAIHQLLHCLHAYWGAGERCCMQHVK